MEKLTTEQKPRIRVVKMGLYWGDWFQGEMPPRYHLTPTGKSPFTVNREFISRSAERAYEMWRAEVEYWEGKTGASPELAS